MAWTAWTWLGGAGSTTGSTTVDFSGAGAPGSGKRYKVTGFELSWNNNGAYILDAGSNTFTVQIVSGSTTVTVGTYYRQANAARPTISWSGTMMCPENTKVQYNQIRNGGTAGIKNAYAVRINIETLTRPTVSAGSTITKAQMDSLRTWKGGSGTAVTQYDTIKASIGTTYKSVSAGTAIDDAWYNSVT